MWVWNHAPMTDFVRDVRDENGHIKTNPDTLNYRNPFLMWNLRKPCPGCPGCPGYF